MNMKHLKMIKFLINSEDLYCKVLIQVIGMIQDNVLYQKQLKMLESLKIGLLQIITMIL